MEQATFEKAKDLQEKIAIMKQVLHDWNGNYKDNAMKFCGADIYNAVSKLFNDKVNEKINQLQKQFKEL